MYGIDPDEIEVFSYKKQPQPLNKCTVVVLVVLGSTMIIFGIVFMVFLDMRSYA